MFVKRPKQNQKISGCCSLTCKQLAPLSANTDIHK